MSVAILQVLVQTELRLRLRRVSTLVALAAFVVITWALIPDPRHGMTLMAIKDARVLYTTSALAFGSATLASVLLGLGSFYLVRGRVGEDLRSGIGSVIAATAVTNAKFLAARWLGGVLYLLSITAALMCTTMVLHGLRGEGPIQLLVYLQTYGVLLVPCVFFGVSVALLFDSVPFLMGKAGDVLYFFLWMLQFAAVAATQTSLTAYFPALFMLDVSGVGIGIMQMQHLLGTTAISVGVSEFNAALPIVALPSALWSTQIMLMRFACALLASAPVLPAMLLFHRYSPDRVKVGHARARRSPLAWLNSLLRPLARWVRPLTRFAGVLPSSLGRVLAEVTLTLMTAPAAIAALLLALPAAVLVGPSTLPWVVLASVAFWGILISGLSTRDFEANLEEMSAVVNGAAGRYWQQFLATGLLGFMFVGVGFLRWAWHAPLRAAVLIFGVLSLSALASLMGRTSRTARTFVALFLFGLYIITNARDAPLLDWFGSNGVASNATLILQIAITVLALVTGIIYSRRHAH